MTSADIRSTNSTCTSRHFVAFENSPADLMRSHSFFICGQRLADVEVRMSVRLSVCLDRKEVLCRVRYQYRGHLSRPKSLVGIFRQVTTLKSDRIVRFAQKTPKKIFPTKKQTENCVCSLSNLIISQ